jgi:hypothetical protein
VKPEKQNKIQKIWANKWNILEGIYNSVFLKHKYKKVVKARAAICKGCEHYDIVGTSCIMKGTQPCCGACGCSLKFKQHSLSSGCDLGKWKPVLTEEEEDAFNNKINSK